MHYSEKSNLYNTGSHVFQSCVFHPCDLVPRFPVLRFPPLRFGPSFSSPAFSTPAFLMVPRFPVLHFQHPPIINTMADNHRNTNCGYVSSRFIITISQEPEFNARTSEQVKQQTYNAIITSKFLIKTGRSLAILNSRKDLALAATGYHNTKHQQMSLRCYKDDIMNKAQQSTDNYHHRASTTNLTKLQC